MLNKKEITSIIIAILILTVSLCLLDKWNSFGIIIASIFFIIGANTLTKKAISYYLDSKIEIRLWEIKRYGFRPDQEFKRPFPAGIFFPVILSALSFGNLVWLASLVFEIKPKVYRSAKRHGLYSFSEVTEFQIGLIAAAGILINLILAVIGYFVGLPMFARLSIWFAFFNMIPISNLDGNKIFFGSLVIWSFLASIVLIGVAYIFLLV